MNILSIFGIIFLCLCLTFILYISLIVLCPWESDQEYNMPGRKE